MELLSNPPSNRLVIGNTGNEGFLTAEIEEHGKGTKD
jgi:hypothetical protein